MIAFSSGAALGGSPLSGGYAGGKATIKFITSCAAGESGQDSLGTRFVSVLQKLSPAADLGANGVTARAARQGDLATFLQGLGPALTPEQVSKANVQLATDPGHNHPACLLTPAGPNPVG